MFEKRQVKLNDLESVARELINYSEGIRVFAFYGKMGAGKTSFIQALCRVLHSADTVNSPSFAIVNEYSTADGAIIYHFDFYRIKNLEEAYDLGYEDYFYSENFCFIEWPEKIETILPAEYIEVTIEDTGNGERSIVARQVR